MTGTSKPRLLLAAASLSVMTGSACAQDQDGAAAFNNACRTCHSIRAGDHRLGPSLAGVVGRKAGSVEGFAYSSALRGGSLTWDAATLDRFLATPDTVAPGNAMKPFTGIQAAGDRAAIIGFLESLGAGR